MKRIILMTALILATTYCIRAQDSKILDKRQGSITFVVDKHLPKPANDHIVPVLSQAERLKSVGDMYYSLDNSYIAASFWNTKMNTGDTPFFTGMVQAFADHRPVSLSPDVIWMLISQAFSQEVNSDPERFRDKFVDFDGKVDLIVQSKKQLYDPQFDWTGTIDGFAQKIDECTKSDVARLLTADFSTTGTIERMASEIVLMETTKSFFNFIVMYISCGIPSVTLTGTVQDWQKVLDKTVGLKKLGAGSWASDLEPILKQFVKAAQGNPEQSFWQDMVMVNTPERLQGGGCSFETPTNLDGWFLKLMPFDKDGNPTPAKVPHNSRNFPVEMASVPAKYIEVDSLNGEVIKTIDLKISGGITGYTADEKKGTVSFHLGWAVNRSDSDETIEKLKQEAPYEVRLRVSKVPEELQAVKHYRKLELRFTEKVEIPDWMDDMDITELLVEGKLTADEKKDLERRFGMRITFKEPQSNAPIDGYPLIVVDGSIVDVPAEKKEMYDFGNEFPDVQDVAKLLDIPANSIKSVTTLRKNSAATIIWGTRGRNGVLEVQTKR